MNCNDHTPAPRATFARRRPSHDIKKWAKDEAEVRMKRLENEEEVCDMGARVCRGSCSF